MTPSKGPRTHYTSASQHQVNVCGTVQPQVYFQDGTIVLTDFDVLDPLSKPIIAVSRLSYLGYRMVVEAGLSYLENKTSGALHRIYERHGVYVLPVWLRAAPGSPLESQPPSPFSGARAPSAVRRAAIAPWTGARLTHRPQATRAKMAMRVSCAHPSVRHRPWSSSITSATFRTAVGTPSACEVAA